MEVVRANGSGEIVLVARPGSPSAYPFSVVISAEDARQLRKALKQAIKDAEGTFS